MKYIQSLLLVFLFLTSSTHVNAQHSGYLGKKFAIGYSGNLGVGLNYKELLTKPFSFQYTNKVGLQYYASNRIGFEASYLFDKFQLPSKYNFNFHYKIQGSPVQTYIYQPEYLSDLKGYSASVIFYDKDYIAPVGTFTKLEIIRLDYSSSDKIQGTMSSLFIEANHKFGTSYYANIGFGKNWILYDKFLLSFDVEIAVNTNIKNAKGIFLPKYSNSHSSGDYISGNKYDIQIFYNSWVNEYLNNVMFVKYNFGIHYLFNPF